MNKKIEQFLFYLLLFCLPLQTRLLFYAPSGNFIEWSSAFFYLTDGLILSLLASWAVRYFFSQHTEKFRLLFSDYCLGIFLVLAGLSVYVAADKTLATYHWLRLLEMVGLFYFVKTNWQKINWSVGGLVVVASGLVQSVIAIGQAFTQHDLGLRWLGETVLGPYFNGVAVVPLLSGGGGPTSAGNWLRAYGTLPHPNVLAIFLVGVIAVWLMIYFSKAQPRLSGAGWLLIYACLLFAFYCTFSRIIIGGTIIFAVLGWLIWYFLNRHTIPWRTLFKRKTVYFLLVTFMVSLIWLGAFHLPALARLNFFTDDQAITERLYYNSIGGGAVSLRPWLGVGPGNFVNWFMTTQPDLPFWFYQPIHNLYLLLAAEVGLPALLALLFFLGNLVFSGPSKHPSLSFNLGLLLVFLFFGLFDHFFWTTQQGQLIFWLTLGYVGGRTKLL